MFTASFFRSALRPLFVSALFLSAVAAFAQSPSAADGFDPNVDGNVYVLATQADGKLLVAGQFTSLRPGVGASAIRNNLARLNPDGSVDATFDPNANGPIRALVLQPDGRIVIGGDFTALQPNGAATTTTRNRVARLNANGTLDLTFNPNISGGTLPQVNALALQPNGKLVVGGRFTTVQPGTTAAGDVWFSRIRTTQPVGEVRAGRSPGGIAWVAAIEPMHGNTLAIYRGSASADLTSSRLVLDESLNQGHGLATGDLLGTGFDQIVVGSRGAGKPGDTFGLKLYAPAVAPDTGWKLAALIDNNQMACEDLKIADLNGDGRPDIIAAGRATKNVIIYWNETSPPKP